jgi:branched-chain amino acid transport system substrate-binding protein
MSSGRDNLGCRVLAWTVALGLFGFAAAESARAEPIRIGMSVSLTGPTASAGKQVLAGLEIWRGEVNAKGGLLGRPVELIYYDDQASPANAPGIYAKLTSIDKVDLLIGPYSTNVIAAALPAIIQSNRTTIGIFGLGANQMFNYPKYFSMNSQGPSPGNYSKCLFDLAAEQKPRPVRVALVGADVEYSRHALDGARANAKAAGFEIVFERTYPPSTTEFSPIVRAMQAANPDVVFAATLPVDTAGIITAAKEINFRPKMIGGAMLGLLVTAIEQKLGPDINGYINNAFYTPAPGLQFDGTERVLQDYQSRAAQLGTDPLGYTYPLYAYASGQILGKAVSATQSLDADKLAAYMHANTFDTVIGPIAFGSDGEWATPKIMCVQFRDISGHDLSEFKDWSHQVVVYPPQYQTGKVAYPLEPAVQ